MLESWVHFDIWKKKYFEFFKSPMIYLIYQIFNQNQIWKKSQIIGRRPFEKVKYFNPDSRYLNVHTSLETKKQREIGLSLTSDYLWPPEFGLSLTIPKSAKSELDYLWPLVKDNPNSDSHRYFDSFSKFKLLSLENLWPFNRYMYRLQHAVAMVQAYF